uniref:Serpin domain-containing protein n=1 Tax=Clastoptera arizonana TaxID=38151 RepID=A0A1B6DSP6_9HEMI
MKLIFGHLLFIIYFVAEARIVFENDSEAQKISGTNHTPPIMDIATKTRAHKLISQALGRLCLEIEDAVFKSSHVENIIFSPLSIASALAIVLLGAQGITYKEVANLLGVSAGIDLTGRNNLVHEELASLIDRLRIQHGLKSGLEVSVASAVFVQQGLNVKEYFKNTAQELYKCDVLDMDFKHNSEISRKQINQWVENKTDGHIKKLLETTLSHFTKSIIANAIYFKGQWEYPFYPENITKMKPFHISRNETIDVPTMVNNADIPYYIDKERNCTIIGIPYKGLKVTMFIVIPNNDIRDLIANLTINDLNQFVDSTKITSVIFFVPKMKLESTIHMRKPFEDLGITSLFSPDIANLSNIAENVFVNEIVHKIDIEITESGTTAAAATAISIYKDGSTPVVKVDKPFIFFIRHNETEVILFWGTVKKPNYHWTSLHHNHLKNP